MSHRKFSEIEILVWLEEYSNGMSINNISKKYKVVYKCIRREFKRRDIELRKHKINTIEDFLKNIFINKDDKKCWEWIGGQDRGYGIFSINSKQHLAHRYSYLHFYGFLPENLFVCHKCDNRKCVNPDHLFLGTHNDNMKDMFDKKKKQ